MRKQKNMQKNSHVKAKTFLQRKNYIENFLIMSPPLIGFLLFGAVPLILSIYMSMTELHSPLIDEAKWVGFENFLIIFQDKQMISGKSGAFSTPYITTFVLLLNVPISIVIGLIIAQLINKVKYLQRFFRSVFFIPYMCSVVVISMSFKLLYNESFGVFNQILTALNFMPYKWINGSAFGFLISTLIMSVWSGIGFCAVLFQAALSNVDKSYYEAAEIDGASSFTTFWRITLPAVSPTTGFLFTIKIIGSMQIMAETQILSLGVAGSSPYWPGEIWYVSDTVVTFLYNMIMKDPEVYGYGMASAVAWVLTIIILILTRINFILQKRFVSYDF